MGTSEGNVCKEFGGSIPVENVQSLASKNLNNIPPCYIRQELDELLDDDSSLEVPVVDMNKLVLGHKDEMEKLHLTCKHWGFFQMINHGALDEIEKMKVVTQEFFKLPLEEKMVCALSYHTALKAMAKPLFILKTKSLIGLI